MPAAWILAAQKLGISDSRFRNCCLQVQQLLPVLCPAENTVKLNSCYFNLYLLAGSDGIYCTFCFSFLTGANGNTVKQIILQQAACLRFTKLALFAWMIVRHECPFHLQKNVFFLNVKLVSCLPQLDWEKTLFLDDGHHKCITTCIRFRIYDWWEVLHLTLLRARLCEAANIGQPTLYRLQHLLLVIY